MQMVFGYCIGYVIVVKFSSPYYKLKLTSIYGFLGGRLAYRLTKRRGFFLDQPNHRRFVPAVFGGACD